MRAGTLRHRVTIESPVETSDGQGGTDRTYEPWLTRISAHVLPGTDGMRGGETYVSQQIQAEVTTRIRIRYRRGITVKHRVRHEHGAGRPTEVDLYDILAVTPADERNEELWLWCKLREGQGFRTGDP